MKFRNIEIFRLVFQILRSNYSIARRVENGSTILSLNVLYRYLVCCLYDIKAMFTAYDAMRRKNYMIASCSPVNGQANNVLNELFGEYGTINVTLTTYQAFYLWDVASTTEENKVYMYTSDTNQPIYLGWPGAASNITIIEVPQNLVDDADAYSEFIAVLRALVPYGVNYTIQVTES